MFDQNSRYYSIENAKMCVIRDGIPCFIIYKKRRLIENPGNPLSLIEHHVVRGDRLDLVTARYLGDPMEFWRLCDGSNVIRPDELEEVGRVITVAISDLP